MNEYDDLKKLFNTITIKKKVGHAFLFNVDDSYDTSLAIGFIKEILKNDVANADTGDSQYEKFSYQLDNNTFPDLMIIKSFDKVIKKEQILNIKSEMKEKSINSGKQFYIIEYAENLNSSSANALLKFLEEPDDEIIAILVTKNINKVIKDNNFKKGILISSERFIKSEYGYEIIQLLNEYIENIHFGISTNPTIEDVESTTKAIKDSNVDFVIALGGGSILDCAKISSCMAAMDTNIRYFLENKLEINKNIPVIAIPTTAGTGSEVTSVSVISDKYTEDKFPIKSEYLLPKIAIIDPELTLTVPKKVTASSGIDVLSHALESYYSKNNNPISDILAIESVKLVMNNLKNAVNNLDNIEYRENMCQASLLAGIAFSVTGTAACHGISYPLTSKYNIPHGEACGITQDKVLLLNSKVEFDRIDKLSKQVGYSNVEEFSNEIYKLKKGIGLANNLRDYNIKKDELETIASLCTSLNILANPYELNKEEILKLLQSIY